MARPHKKTVDYFPHSAIPGKTLFKIESRWGNDGYAFWFKLLELLCQSDGHIFDYGNIDERDFLLAKSRVNENIANEILEKLSEWGNIDRELWMTKKIWCQKLVDNIQDAYKKRLDQFPQKPVSETEYTGKGEFPEEETQKSEVSGTGNRESKVNESKEKVNNNKKDVSEPETHCFGNPIQEKNKDHSEVMDHFHNLHLQKTGIKPLITGAEGKLVKTLLQSQNKDNIIDKLSLYYSNEYWFNKDGRDFKQFYAHYNEIIEPLKNTGLKKPVNNEDRRAEFVRRVCETPQKVLIGGG